MGGSDYLSRTHRQAHEIGSTGSRPPGPATPADDEDTTTTTDDE